METDEPLPMITRLNHFSAKPDTIDALKDFLGGVVSDVRNLPGCISCRLLQSHADAAQFVVFEEWDSIEAHQLAAKAIPSERVQAVLALLKCPPAGEYYLEAGK